MSFRLSGYGKKIATLGTGGYGKVYLYNNNGRIYAVKKQFLYTEEGEFNGNIFNEIAYVKSLCCHQNIINFRSILYDDDVIYITMPASPYDLRKAIRRGLSMSVKKKISYDLCKGLYHIHAHNILHRDIKPDNILMFGDDAVIADFGLAISGICNKNISLDPKRYTLWYRAPELLLTGRYDFSADVWALGMTLLELYLEKPVAPGDNELDQIYKIFGLTGTPSEEVLAGINDKLLLDLSDVPKLPSTLSARLAGYDPELQVLIWNMLNFDPHLRWSMSEVLDSAFFSDISDDDYQSLTCESKLKSVQSYAKHSYINNPANRYRLIDKLYELSLRLGVPAYLQALTITIFDKLNELVILHEDSLPLYFSTCLYLVDGMQDYNYVKEDEILRLAGVKMTSVGNEFQTDEVADVEMTASQNEPQTEGVVDVRMRDIENALETIVKTLDYNLYISTVIDFVNLFILDKSLPGKHSDELIYSVRTIDLARLLALLTYQSNLAFQYEARDLALACVYIATKINNEPFYQGLDDIDPDLITLALRLPRTLKEYANKYGENTFRVYELVILTNFYLSYDAISHMLERI